MGISEINLLYSQDPGGCAGGCVTGGCVTDEIPPKLLAELLRLSCNPGLWEPEIVYGL